MKQPSPLEAGDRQLAKLIDQERMRQEDDIELIPSENFASPMVREAMGSILTNKYSEGYPGKRYYGGNVWIDKVEALTQERALRLFKLSPKRYAVNVQPYSGSPANIAVYVALAPFGSRLMGMNLSEGGHLTHGHAVNFSGMAYNFFSYGVRSSDQRLDYTMVAKLARKHKPKILISGATAYSRSIDFKKFQRIAKSVKAIHMADISHIAGLVAAGQHPSPFPFTDVVTTTTHKTLRGPRGAVIFSKLEFSHAIDRAVFPGLQGGPHEHVIAAKAVCFKEAMTSGFRLYAKQIILNSRALSGELMKRGYHVITGGTDNHLFLIDLRDRGIGGKEAEQALDAVGITVNKNTVPPETRKPFDPSGIRLGTPAVTTRGMKTHEMVLIAEMIDEALSFFTSSLSRSRHLQVQKRIRRAVVKLARAFPFL